MTKHRNPITRLVSAILPKPSQAQAQAQHQEPEEEELEPTVKMSRRFISYGD